MTGFTYGQADDAVEGIVWTECVLGRGYDLLRLADERRRQGGWPMHALEVGPNAATIRLPCLPAYSFGARLADLAIELALGSSAEQISGIRAYGAFGGWIAPYIAWRIARAGQHAAVLWRPAIPILGMEAPAMLVLADPAAKDSEMPPFTIVSAGQVDGAGSQPPRQNATSLSLLEAIRKAAGPASQESLFAIASTSAAPSGEDVDASACSAILTDLGLLGIPMSLDTSERMKSAVRFGMDVPSEKHAFLNTLSQRIRMPNTERSKSQAG